MPSLQRMSKVNGDKYETGGRQENRPLVSNYIRLSPYTFSEFLKT